MFKKLKIFSLFMCIFCFIFIVSLESLSYATLDITYKLNPEVVLSARNINDNLTNPSFFTGDHLRSLFQDGYYHSVLFFSMDNTPISPEDIAQNNGEPQAIFISRDINLPEGDYLARFYLYVDGNGLSNCSDWDPPGAFYSGWECNGGKIWSVNYNNLNMFWPEVRILAQLLGSDVLDVFRLEVWHKDTNGAETIIGSDTIPIRYLLQPEISDFNGDDKLSKIDLRFSTGGYQNGSFILKVKWLTKQGDAYNRIINFPGMPTTWNDRGYGWNGGMEKVELYQAPGITNLTVNDGLMTDLNKKANYIDSDIKAEHLDNGQIIKIPGSGANHDEGDAALWTGVYAATQAMKYKTTRDPVAKENMENALRALNRLVDYGVNHGNPGYVPRYIDYNRVAYSGNSSKDTYTGVMFGYAMAYDQIEDISLKNDVQTNVKIIVKHFIDHNFHFVDQASGTNVDLSPYMSYYALSNYGILQPLNFAVYLISTFSQGYFVPGFLNINNMFKYLYESQAFVFYDSNLYSFVENNTIYNDDLSNKKFPSPDSLLGLMMLKTADTIIPDSTITLANPIIIDNISVSNPTYREYYENNLSNNYQFLPWVKVTSGYTDYNLMKSIFTEKKLDLLKACGETHHLSWFAAYTLMTLENNSAIKNEYKNLLKYMWLPYSDEYNSMYNFMNFACDPNSTFSQKGRLDGIWSLKDFPYDKIGTGLRTFPLTEQGIQISEEDLGGIIGYQSDTSKIVLASPVPMLFRYRNAFCWQQSPRDFAHDDAGTKYSGLDYLFAYWLGRSNNIITVPQNSEITNQELNGLYEGVNEITIGPNVTVENNANVTVKAGDRIVIKPYFIAKEGSYLHLCIE
ncbi:MAG: hypothetical protein PHX78_03860 [bacterium]|nr:hypothetical protein [bacterium]